MEQKSVLFAEQLLNTLIACNITTIMMMSCVSYIYLVFFYSNVQNIITSYLFDDDNDDDNANRESKNPRKKGA